MSQEALVEAPFTLASLPTPYDATAGKTLAAPVYGLRAQRWRKRSEIAVAVDGDGITIYNVRNPRLVTSYALPPQTRFLCPPYSVYYKPSGQKAQRVTYAAVTNSAEKKSEVVAFVEEVKSDSSDLSAESQIKTSYPLSNKPVLALCPLASHSDNTDLASALDLCLVYEDGTVETISGDLASKRWDAEADQAIALAQGASVQALGHVQYATVTDVEKARKGLLKSREDALAVVVGSDLANNSAALNVPLLVLAAVSEGTSRIHIFALPSRSKHLVSTTHPGLHHLLTYDLPSSGASATGSDKATFSLHASSGKLQQLLAGSLTTYDLSTTVPRVLSTLTSRPSNPYSSFVQLTPALVMASDSSTCAMFDTKYSSLQGQLPLTGEYLASASGKRKKTEGASTLPLHFVAFFSDLGLAAAISGNALVGLQLNVSAPVYKKSRSGTSLLINSLGKGLDHVKGLDSETEAAFSTWRTQIDSLLAEGDIDPLERFLAAELENGLSKSQKPTKRGKHGKDKQPEETKEPKAVASAQQDDSTMQLVSHSPSQTWDFKTNKNLVQRTDRRKALYILSRMFAWTSDLSQDQSSIRFVFFAANIFKWLALVGYMNTLNIERALRECPSETPAVASAKVNSGDLMRALAELDPEMHIMHEFLGWPIHIDIDEVAVALRTLVKSLDDPQPGLISKLITSGALDTNLLPEAHATSDEQGALEAAEADLQYATAQLETGLNVRSTSLRTVFHRLHSFPASSIVTALKSHLQQAHLIFFIQLLRVELADGGWTTRYLDYLISPRVAELSEGERPADNSLIIISNLLSCGVDAVGLQGWMVPPSQEKDNVIETLRAETSAAMEGAYEACEMGSFLCDFERFAHTLHQQAKEEKKDSSSSKNAGKVDAIKRPGFEDLGDVVDPVLPMGMKVQKIEKMLVRAGGREQKKSKSLLGKERSMRVGKYSFDRIRV
ncbi:hypothetical protein AAFC00_006276 [Neodothiora populina]|uniref:Utp8 beta-propeller domain-containing protein n=1 Tax=Neodothiora populina TaxID=2781224 RepID=A0ABR3P4M7_9PEZI